MDILQQFARKHHRTLALFNKARVSHLGYESKQLNYRIEQIKDVISSTGVYSDHLTAIIELDTGEFAVFDATRDQESHSCSTCDVNDSAYQSQLSVGPDLDHCVRFYLTDRQRANLNLDDQNDKQARLQKMGASYREFCRIHEELGHVEYPELKPIPPDFAEHSCHLLGIMLSLQFNLTGHIRLLQVLNGIRAAYEYSPRDSNIESLSIFKVSTSDDANAGFFTCYVSDDYKYDCDARVSIINNHGFGTISEYL